jgi:hypothetical protein
MTYREFAKLIDNLDESKKDSNVICRLNSIPDYHDLTLTLELEDFIISPSIKYAGVEKFKIEKPNG